MHARIIGVALTLGLVTCGDDGQTPDAAGSSSSTAASTSASTGAGATAATTGAVDGSSGTDSTGDAPFDPGPPPPRIDCGTPTLADGLRRAPYLQSISNTSAHVVWTTTNPGLGVVRIAESADGPWTEHEAGVTLFEASYTLDTEDYYAFDTEVTGLRPNAAYCYEIVEDDVTLASGLSLYTAWSTSERGVRIVAFGDSGNGSPEQLGLRDVMMERDYDVFLHLGDMAYGSGTFVEFEQFVFEAYRDLMHGTPAYPAIGNHEYKTDEGQPYLDVYSLWDVALRAEHAERYYSFDYGDVHFVALDSNPEMLLSVLLEDEEADDTMLDWLRADLAASDKPWKIAFFHHPPYSSGEHGSDVLSRDLMSGVLEEGGVDLVVAGHDHHYERATAIRAGQPTAHRDGGITYFVVGSGGAGLRTAEGDWFTEFVDDEHHAYLDLVVFGCEARGQAIAIDGSVIDEFTLSGC